MKELISYQDAVARVARYADLLPKATLPLVDALGLTLAAPIRARCDMPSFDNSAVDGYAIREDDLDQRDFRVGGAVRAGEVFGGPWRRGVALRVFTGAALPPRCGAVVMQEDTRVSGKSLTLCEPIRPGMHLRRRGEERRKGDAVAYPGERVTPALVAAAAACGNAQIQVLARPRLGIVCTGSELTPPGEPLEAGRIYESNGVGLAAAARALGLAEPKVYCVSEDLNATAEAIGAVAETCDVVITTGGVSVGDHDHTNRAFAKAGFKCVFWGVRMKPGKPVAFYRRRQVGAFGLPGNPLSAMVGWCVLVRPYLRLRMGIPHELNVVATAGAPIPHKPDRLEFVPGRLCGGVVTPLVSGGSHMLGGLAAANALVQIEEGCGDVAPGESVGCWPLEWFNG
ncbi:MAG: molybdopterin molybdotransferase MoeA [Nitrospirae bacterium]|nr:molybdopterin molybdotransferase MoeA [Fimbriimonadaceae bacterium]